MGVLPLQFGEGDSIDTLGITGDEEFDLLGVDGELSPRQEVVLQLRGDTPVFRRSNPAP